MQIQLYDYKYIYKTIPIITNNDFNNKLSSNLIKYYDFIVCHIL